MERWLWIVMWLSLSSGWKWTPAKGIGMNWGTRATHPLPPDIVVGLLKDNGITKVKLFDAEKHAVRALANTGVEVMVGIPNDQLKVMASSFKAAVNWVESNVTEFKLDGSVDIRVNFLSNVKKSDLAIVGFTFVASIWIWCGNNPKAEAFSITSAGLSLGINMNSATFFNAILTFLLSTSGHLFLFFNTVIFNYSTKYIYNGQVISVTKKELEMKKRKYATRII